MPIEFGGIICFGVRFNGLFSGLPRHFLHNILYLVRQIKEGRFTTSANVWPKAAEFFGNAFAGPSFKFRCQRPVRTFRYELKSGREAIGDNRPIKRYAGYWLAISSTLIKSRNAPEIGKRDALSVSDSIERFEFSSSVDGVYLRSEVAQSNPGEGEAIGDKTRHQIVRKSSIRDTQINGPSISTTRLLRVWVSSSRSVCSFSLHLLRRKK